MIVYHISTSHRAQIPLLHSNTFRTRTQEHPHKDWLLIDVTRPLSFWHTENTTYSITIINNIIIAQEIQGYAETHHSSPPSCILTKKQNTYTNAASYTTEIWVLFSFNPNCHFILCDGRVLYIIMTLGPVLSSCKPLNDLILNNLL